MFCIYQNNSIVISKFDYKNPAIPNGFNGFKIAHISDLHNKAFGGGQVRILTKLKGISPDIIVVTGDLVDRRRYDLDTAMMFITGTVELAPVYYVSGNHEAWSGSYPHIKEQLVKAGVHVLDDTKTELIKGKDAISIMGVKDPGFWTFSPISGEGTKNVAEELNKWSKTEGFKILLSHRPELFDLYCENKMDLIFAGHAHGGQIRMPFIGALIAPDQGIFPEYTWGSYEKDISTMFVSRGLGNSIIPLRVFNRPEIIMVTLKKDRN